MIEDMKDKQQRAIKLQEGLDMTTKEITTMKKITQVYLANRGNDLSSQEMNYDATPAIKFNTP